MAEYREVYEVLSLVYSRFPLHLVNLLLQPAAKTECSKSSGTLGTYEDSLQHSTHPITLRCNRRFTTHTALACQPDIEAWYNGIQSNYGWR